LSSSPLAGGGGEIERSEIEPGEGLSSIVGENPSPGFSLTLETTLSFQGRGYSDICKQGYF
jgi:hypothetical protein